MKGVRLRGERHRRWLREGDPSVARRLAQIGVLGWIIVVPMLIGVFVGRWLDQNIQLRTVLDRAASDARTGARMLVRLEMDEERMSFLSFDSPADLGHAPQSRRASRRRDRARVLLFPQPVVERPPVCWWRPRG